MKAQRNSSKDGGILLMAMLVVLIFSILTAGLYKLFDTDAMETLSVEHHRRAFWMAEAGLEKVMDRLYLERSFRNNSDTLFVPYTIDYVEGSFSNASYTIESITTSLNSSGTVYTVTSRGMAGSMNRRIQQDVLVNPGGDNAFRSKYGNLRFDSNVHIEGNVFADTGDVTIKAKENLNSTNPTGIDGYLVVGEGSVSGAGASSVDIIDVPLPPQPNIDMAFWAPFLNNATNNANTNGLVGVSAIASTTIVSNYNYSATSSIMQADRGLVISGTVNDTNGLHYVVSATSIEFDNSTELLSQTVVIADGDVTFDQSLLFHDNCVVFATGDIYVRQSADAGGTGATLIAQGDVTFAQSMVFHGIVYADGSVDIGSNAEISGAIMAGGDISVGANVDTVFDPDVFLNPLPGLENVYNQAVFAPLQWREIAP